MDTWKPKRPGRSEAPVTRNWRLLAALGNEMWRAGRVSTRLAVLLVALGTLQMAFAVTIPLLGWYIIDALVLRRPGPFYGLLAAYGAVMLLEVGLTYAFGLLVARTNEHVGNGVRKLAFRAALRRRPWTRADDMLGDLMARVLNDVASVKGILSSIALQALFDVLTLAVVLVLLIGAHARLALLTLAVLPASIVWRQLTGARLEKASLQMRETVGRLTEHVQSWLGHRLAVSQYGVHSIAEARVDRVSDALEGQSVLMMREATRINAMSTLLIHLPSLCVFGYGGFEVLRGELSVGALYAFSAYAAYLRTPAQRLISTWLTAVPTLMPATVRLMELLKEGTWEPGRLPAAVSNRPASLEATGVEWRFPGHDGYALHVPRFVAERGSLTGITGGNGTGKTTLLCLLAGVIAPTLGVVEVRSEDGEIWPGHIARDAIDVCPQRPPVFTGSFIENLTLFSASPLERVAAVAKTVGLSSLALPESLGGDAKGVTPRLSGGQVQRLALGRVLYRDRPIVLLDEPTEGLDESMSDVFMREILALKKDRIVVVVSHFDQLLARCDRLYRITDQSGEGRCFSCTLAPAPSRVPAASTPA